MEILISSETDDPLVEYVEIGPIKVESNKSEDYDSNEEIETQSKRTQIEPDLSKKYMWPIKTENDISEDSESNEETETPSKRTRVEQDLSKNNKRQRGKNFSVAEEHVLVDLVESQLSIFENKRNDTASWKQKDEAWQKLAVQFSSQAGVNRPWKALKDKYENLKKKSRKEYAGEKRQKYRTGGGVANCKSQISQRIAGMIQVSATELENEVDDDVTNNYSVFVGDGDNKGMPMSTSNLYEDSDIHTNQEYIPDMHGSIGGLKAAADSSMRQTKVESLAPLASWKSAKSKDKKSEGLTVCRRKRTLEEEKCFLMKLQQDLYRQENIRGEKKEKAESERAAELHIMQIQKLKLEIEGIRLKNELLKLELLEKQQSKT